MADMRQIAAMGDTWFYKMMGQEFGPFCVDELQRIIASDERLADVLVREHPQDEWQFVWRFEELKVGRSNAVNDQDQSKAIVEELTPARPDHLTPQQRFLLVLFGVVFPCLIALINYVVLRQIITSEWQVSGVITTFVVYIVEIGALGFGLGYCIQHPVLRLAILIWCVVFIDFLLLIQGLSRNYFGRYGLSARNYADSLLFAMLSGQIGMVAVWAVLGNTNWVWRLPATFIGISLLGYLLFSVARGGSDFTTVILFCQTAATASLGALMWVFGFRIQGISAPSETNEPDPGRWIRGLFKRGANQATTHVLPSGKRLQFSMWHMFIWTTALAPVFAILRLVDWASIKYLSKNWFFQYSSLGTAFALVSLVALWAALGRERFVNRLAVLTLLAPLWGSVIGALMLWGWWDIDYLSRRLSGATDVIMMWIAWTFIAAFFLAGMLMFFRGRGLRLVRVVTAQANTPDDLDSHRHPSLIDGKPSNLDVG